MAMLKSPHERELFEEVFGEYWYGRALRPAPLPPEQEPADAGAGAERLQRESDEERAAAAASYSATEVLRRRDVALYTEEEWAYVRELMARLAFGGPWRRSRRERRMSHGQLDLRRTVRMSIRTEGDPLRFAFKDTPLRQRRVVLACDVSGSMEVYSRALLQLMHSAVVGRRRVEAFAFGTRLTRLTEALAGRNPDAALRRASEEVTDWAGGTRIGESLATLNRRYNGAVHGAVVVIASDGWDTGDPTALAEEMARLHRLAYRVVWMNPLKHLPEFAPVAQGMAAALPHVDHFLEGHSLASFERLIDLLDEICPRGMRGDRPRRPPVGSRRQPPTPPRSC
jgi:uncharacterized protein with von Willebrand factor type A (vWA) domain